MRHDLVSNLGTTLETKSGRILPLTYVAEYDMT